MCKELGIIKYIKPIDTVVSWEHIAYDIGYILCTQHDHLGYSYHRMRLEDETGWTNMELG